MTRHKTSIKWTLITGRNLLLLHRFQPLPAQLIDPALQIAQHGFFFKLDGDAGCDPQDTQTTHSQGLAALANVSAHELSEARTDPATPGAWYDSQGQENGDKCAWTFNVPYVTFPNVRCPAVTAT